VTKLRATTAAGAIEELIEALAEPLGGLGERAARLVAERETTAPTGLGDEVAIPHATVPGLTQPLLAFGASPGGIDFDSPDGRAAKLVFLLLMPPRAHAREVRILAQIARLVLEPSMREKLLRATSRDELLPWLAESEVPPITAQRRKQAQPRLAARG
jgi:PTS system fructose-specific IIC component